MEKLVNFSDRLDRGFDQIAKGQTPRDRIVMICVGLMAAPFVLAFFGFLSIL